MEKHEARGIRPGKRCGEDSKISTAPPMSRACGRWLDSLQRSRLARKPLDNVLPLGLPDLELLPLTGTRQAPSDSRTDRASRGSEEALGAIEDVASRAVGATAPTTDAGGVLVPLAPSARGDLGLRRQRKCLVNGRVGTLLMTEYALTDSGLRSTSSRTVLSSRPLNSWRVVPTAAVT